jgi:hypothetical protein
MWYLWQHVLQIVFIRTYQGLHLWKYLWTKLSALCIVLNLSYNFVYVISRRCLIWGSWSLYPLLNFSTSFWLEEGLVFSCQKSCTSPLTDPINFMSKQGSLLVEAHKYVFPPVSRISHLWEYFLMFLTFHFMRCEVCCRKWCYLMILLIIDCVKTCRATLRSLEEDLLTFFWKTSTRFLTIWWLFC